MQIFEIIAAFLLLALALWLFIGNLHSKGQGKCDSCAAKCPSRDLPESCSDLIFLEKKKN